jgi:serine phosphatase RsbU (regulator of sigma subunit)
MARSGDIGVNSSGVESSAINSSAMDSSSVPEQTVPEQTVPGHAVPEQTVPMQGGDYSARLARAAGLDIAVRYRPAGTNLVAGDWYDTLVMPSGDLLLVVGDVAGHGVDVVTGMVAARGAVRDLAAADESPPELLRKLNHGACRLADGITGTIVCGRYNPATRVMRWARAGHLPPVLVRDDAAWALDEPPGLMLGVDPEARYDERVLCLLPGDTLLLYTDGLIERRVGSISDALADLEAAAVPAEPSADRHAARILASAASDTGDDACLLVVRVL